jgi:transposase InsO family protein
VVGCVETIAERHLLPVLEAMLHQFPFRIRGFHCDNGSEFINRAVAGLWEKLRVEFTKSRTYRTTDNALVEGKNGAVVRKQIGYGPINAAHAAAFQKFYTKHFNSYVNYHRPCGFAQVKTLARGRRRRLYPTEDYRTPFEKLSSLPNWERHLKSGVTAAALERLARQLSDTDAARQRQKAKQMLLARSRGERS